LVNLTLGLSEASKMVYEMNIGFAPLADDSFFMPDLTKVWTRPKPTSRAINIDLVAI
jgi:hypothetical protein